MATVDPETLLKYYSMVFQDVVLFRDTVMENIRLGRRGATDEEVIAAAKAARCDAFIRKLPKRISDHDREENGSTLSGGERQRISIARALLKDAPVILLDEATASLDVENDECGSGSPLPSASGQDSAGHRPQNAYCRRCGSHRRTGKMVMWFSRETPEELMEQGGLYRRMVELQKEASDWKLVQ